MGSAKNMMKDLETELQNEGFGNDKIELKFKGLKTSDYINPTAATALFCDVDRSASFDSVEKLKKLCHRVVSEALKRNLVSKNDLSRSFIVFQDANTSTES